MASISRSYRPQTFDQIAAQDGIKETLRKEVETGILGHAYLFAGPRGIGKTTMARVFAKALNCLNSKAGEPCNECDSCKDIAANKSLDVIEMDAASHTGVDNIREAIIEHVRFVPHGRKHKIYILDEAHMLSGSAWNALLKTLEEPPSYAVFLLVTTELHKVPDTILSRCQRFDFKRVSAEVLGKRVAQLAKNENVKLDQKVIDSIVSKADGSVRDAESLLGQLLVLGETIITPELASLVLPASRLPLAAELLEIWSKRQLGHSISKVGELEEKGIALLPLFDDLIHATRHLLIAADSIDWKNKLAKGDEGEKKLVDLIGLYEPAELSDMALMLMERRRDAKQGADVRFCLELAAAAVALGVLPHAKQIEPETTKNDPNPLTVSKPSSVIDEETPLTTPNNIRRDEAMINNMDDVKKLDPNLVKTANVSLSKALTNWQAMIKAVDEKSPSLTFILKLCRAIDICNNTLVISFKYAFHKDKIIKDIKNKRLVEDCLNEVLHTSGLLIDGIIENEDTKQTEVRERDMVSSILKAFEGQIVEEKGNP